MSKFDDKTPSLTEVRNYKAVKSNALIQDAAFELSTQELKIVLFLASKIRMTDDNFSTYVFNLDEFCEVCGIDAGNGKNYENIRNSLKKLTERSVWVKNKYYETWLRWIESPQFFPGTGTVHVKFSEDMKPFLLQLKENFTPITLYYVLPMQSHYSIRLYELLLSLRYKNEYTFEIQEFKKLIGVKPTVDLAELRRRVLDIAMKEMEKYSDLNVNYELIKEWRTCTHIKFTIKTKKGAQERLSAFSNIENVIGKGDINKFSLMLGQKDEE